jgi:hypothetical protein
VKWLASTVLPSGQIPYILDGSSSTTWPFDTASYVAEGVIASDLLAPLKTAGPHDTSTPWKTTVEWLVRSQNSDGSFGEKGSPDQQRSPRVVSMLQWSALKTGSAAAQNAIDKFKQFLADPPADFGLLDIANTSGFVALVIADLLQFGVTF